jgi:hypothetical protein
VVDPERLELPTPAFEAQCSIQLSYGSVADQKISVTGLTRGCRAGIKIPLRIVNPIDCRFLREWKDSLTADPTMHHSKSASDVAPDATDADFGTRRRLTATV